MFHWIASFLGLTPERLRDAIIVILLSIIVTRGVKISGLLIQYIFSFFRSEGILAGERTIYHFSENNDGEPLFAVQRIKIKRSFTKGYSAAIFNEKNGKRKLVYKGSLNIEGVNYVIQLASTFHKVKNDKETISIRVKRIYANEEQDMPGLYL